MVGVSDEEEDDDGLWSFEWMSVLGRREEERIRGRRGVRVSMNSVNPREKDMGNVILGELVWLFGS